MITAETFTAHIYLAGDLAIARQACREFCQRGLCVTVEALDYIYTGGEEVGVRVGLLNYPKFPADPHALKNVALELAEHLRATLFQDSYLIVFPTETVWESRRVSK